MTPLSHLKLLILSAFLYVLPAAEAAVYLQTPSASGSLPLQDWKSLRDARIVKQSLDYSCGAAALATLLNEYYGESLTELDILLALDKDDMRASFADMQRALPQLGYRALGYAASYEQLARLQVPVLVYLQYRGNEHFSLIRGIDGKTVWLADPSLGNRTFSREQFLSMWDTRSDVAGDDAEAEAERLAGRLLAVLPLAVSGFADEAARADRAFFDNKPKRQSGAALQQLGFSHGL